jgi:putative tricarboxylic transport membrane protein
LILLGSLSFGLLVRPAGVLIALLVMVLLGCAASNEIRLREALLTAMGLAVGSILIFVYALGLPMPIFGRWFG